MDYEVSEAAMGKPGGADLQLGLATGPALFAWEEHPSLGPLIERKFSEPGDVEMVCGRFPSSSLSCQSIYLSIYLMSWSYDLVLTFCVLK
jgi:geranylgeranyl pyrophosphate synthase